MCYRYKIASFNFTRKKKKYTMDSLKEKDQKFKEEKLTSFFSPSKIPSQCPFQYESFRY